MGRKTRTKAPNLMSLQSSREAFKENIKWAHIQIGIWILAIDSEPSALDPAEYGWERDEYTRCMIPLTLLPNLVVVPPEVLDMIKIGSTTDTPCLTPMCGCLAVK
jgi:hypothetical protein